MTEKRQMMLRDVLHATAVAGKRLTATMLKPKIEIFFAAKTFEHHQFMISDQRNEVTMSHQIDQNFDHACRVWPPVNIISKADNDIGWLGLNCLQDSFKGIRATVNIAYGNDA